MTRNRKALTLDEQRALILWPYLDMLEDGHVDGVAGLLMHAGIITTGSDVERAILDHYRKRTATTTSRQRRTICADSLPLPPGFGR